MAFCMNCGKALPDNAKFCAECGASVGVTTQADLKNKRQTVYEGEIHKCPNCGEVLTSFSGVCPVCKNEIRGVDSVSSVNELYRKLQIAKDDSEKIQLVKTFPIPNSKEDILEFMILAVSNFDSDYYVAHMQEEDISDAWLTKIEQCYQKAKLVLGDSQDLIKVTEIYQNATSKIKRSGSKKIIKIVLPVACIVIGLLLMLTDIKVIQTIGMVPLILGIVYLCASRKKGVTNESVVILQNGAMKTGFSSWNGFTKVMWIILNIYTIGIPAIIYAICRKNK